MTFTIRRLNMDTSWQVSTLQTSILIDPWLIGSEVDGFSWFNEQWHAMKPVPLRNLSSFNAVVVTQSYTDHCHQQTLEQLNAETIIGTPKASGRIKKELQRKDILTLPSLEEGTWLKLGDLELAFIDPHRKMDPVYYGLVIKCRQEVIIYFPHGFTLTPHQQSLIAHFQLKALITSFSLFKLPFFLGGAVNPGKENAMALIESLNPEKIFHTHDENKHAKGLVKKIAKIKYPTPTELKNDLGDKFVYLDEKYEKYPLV